MKRDFPNQKINGRITTSQPFQMSAVFSEVDCTSYGNGTACKLHGQGKIKATLFFPNASDLAAFGRYCVEVAEEMME